MRRPRHNKRGERLIDLFAEELANDPDGSVPAASKRLGIKSDYGRVLFKRIRAELGPQAV